MSGKPDDVVDYWKSIGPEGWFAKKDEIDRTIAKRFSGLYEHAAAGKLEDWRKAPDSCLALVLLLDQFSRNLFREDGRAFAQDPYAVDIALQAIADGFDTKVDPALKAFFYMPFMHSESILDQQRGIVLFQPLEAGDYLKFTRIHHDVIARFGRFPHRNPVLGRHTTPAEQAFLDNGGFGGPNFGKK